MLRKHLTSEFTRLGTQASSWDTCRIIFQATYHAEIECSHIFKTVTSMKAKNFVTTAIIVSATAAVARVCLVCMFVCVCFKSQRSLFKKKLWSSLG